MCPKQTNNSHKPHTPHKPTVLLRPHRVTPRKAVTWTWVETPHIPRGAIHRGAEAWTTSRDQRAPMQSTQLSASDSPEFLILLARGASDSHGTVHATVHATVRKPSGKGRQRHILDLELTLDSYSGAPRGSRASPERLLSPQRNVTNVLEHGSR